MIELKEFEARKRDHLQHALDLSNQTSGQNGLDRLDLSHDALPELDFSDLQITLPHFRGKQGLPFFVAGMTAGHERAHEINFKIASACAQKGWMFCIGSLRRDFEASRFYDGIDRTVDRLGELRSRFPQLSMIGNLGLSQLVQAPESMVERIQSLIEHMGLDALAIHLNPLQECLQKEGTPFFKGGLERLQVLLRSLRIPIILKETGSGFSELTLKKLVDVPLHAIDLSGRGGTHWGRIEGKRSSSEIQKRASETFQNWGVSTVDSLLNAQRIFKGRSAKPEIWASGGIRSGLEAAKCFALGAQRVGFAQPVLSAVLESEDRLRQWMDQIAYELKLALFCTGSRELRELSREGVVVWKK